LKDERTTRNALRELEDIGPEAVPQLVRAYRTSDVDVRIPAWQFVVGNGSKLVAPLVNALKSEDPLVREDGAFGLGLLATHGHEAGFSVVDSPNENVVAALIGALKDEHAGVRTHAIDALRAIGPDALGALPTLVEMLEDGSTELSHQIISAIGRLGSDAIPGVEALLQRDSDVVRRRAAAALKMIQVGGLIKQLNDESTWPHSVPALVEIGPDAVGPILRVFEREWMPPYEDVHREDSIIFPAAAVLARMGKEAIPPLVLALKDDSAVLRSVAAEWLGRLGIFAREAESGIGDADDKDIRLELFRGVKLESVLSMQVAIRELAVPALQIALKDADGLVRYHAMGALGDIGPPAREALPDLLELLRNVDAGDTAEYAIAKMGPEVVPALIETLAHHDALVRWRATQALAQIGPDAKEAVPALIQALQDENSVVRGNAANALGMIGVEAREAVQPLIAALGDSDFFVRKSGTAMIALGKIGPAAREAVPFLIQELKAPDSATRTSAAEALAGIGPAAVDAAPALADALKDQNARVRVRASIALAKIGPRATAAVPALIQALSDNLDWLSPREYAARALGEIGPEAGEAVPALTRVLTESDAAAEAKPASTRERWRGYHAQMRAAAAEALGKIGPEAKEAVPVLREALEDKDEGVRQAAAEALQRIQPGQQAP
jgi:HEAT repeat protein